jgi:hypothetical protein
MVRVHSGLPFSIPQFSPFDVGDFGDYGAGRGSLFFGAPIFPIILGKSQCTNGLAIERTHLICPI